MNDTFDDCIMLSEKPVMIGIRPLTDDELNSQIQDRYDTKFIDEDTHLFIFATPMFVLYDRDPNPDGETVHILKLVSFIKDKSLAPLFISRSEWILGDLAYDDTKKYESQTCDILIRHMKLASKMYLNIIGNDLIKECLFGE